MGKMLNDPEAGKRLVPAAAWDQTRAGSSAVKRVPKHMAKTLAQERRRDFGDMMDGGDRAEAMDPRTAAAAAKAVSGGEDDDFL